jgi:hypothetical protein
MPTLGSFIYRLEIHWLDLLKYFVKVSQSELELVFICSGQVPVSFFAIFVLFTRTNLNDIHDSICLQGYRSEASVWLV